MPTLVAVVEAPSSTEPSAPWPTVRGGLIELSAHAADPEIAAIVWQLVLYNRLDTARPLEAITSAENLVLPGGIAAKSDDGRLLIPGCCAGLETWREWLSVSEGEGSPWLGHDPAPWVEHHGPMIRIWSDGGLSDPAPNAFFIELSRAELGRQLQKVQRDLHSFVVRLKDWVEQVNSADAEPVAARFDQMFEVSTAGSHSRGANRRL